MGPFEAALRVVLRGLPFRTAWALRGVSRGSRAAVDGHVWAALGAAGDWFLVFGGGAPHPGDGADAPAAADGERPAQRVHMKAVAFDPASGALCFQAVDPFGDPPGGQFPSQLASLPVYTMHSDRIFWTCALERLARDPAGAVRFEARQGRMEPAVLERIPLRHMGYHQPLVFDDAPVPSGRDFWIAEDGSKWVCRKITTPDFVLGYATRSERPSSPPPASDLSSALSSDFAFQCDAGTDVSVHVLYARATASALFEGEAPAREWAAAHKGIGSEGSGWAVEVSVAEVHAGEHGLVPAGGGAPVAPAAVGCIRLTYGAGGKMLAAPVGRLAAPAVSADEADKGEDAEAEDDEPELPRLCTFRIPPAKKRPDKPEDAPAEAQDGEPAVALALSLRLVREGASDPVLRCDPVSLHPEDLLPGADFSSLSLDFSLVRRGQLAHLALSSAECTDPARLLSSLLLASPRGASRRIPAFSRARAEHLRTACAKLLVGARGRDALLSDPAVLAWLERSPAAPPGGKDAELARMLEERIDAGVAERLKMRRLALSRRAARLERELKNVLPPGCDAAGLAREYWDSKAGEDLRVELKGGDWEPAEAAAEVAREVARRAARKRGGEGQHVPVKGPLRSVRSPLRERNAAGPARGHQAGQAGKSPARKRSRLSNVENDGRAETV